MSTKMVNFAVFAHDVAYKSADLTKAIQFVKSTAADLTAGLSWVKSTGVDLTAGLSWVKSTGADLIKGSIGNVVNK